MKSLYESLFDIDDNLERLDWENIDLMSVFSARDKEEFNMICDIIDHKAEHDKKTSVDNKKIILIDVYKWRDLRAIEVGRNSRKLWYNIYWDKNKNKVVRDKVAGSYHWSDKSVWEMPDSLIPSFKEIEKM